MSFCSGTTARARATCCAMAWGARWACWTHPAPATAIYTYEPFGRASITGTGSANSGRFTGREDDDTGLDFYRARYYHPKLQRFISEDRAGFAACGRSRAGTRASRGSWASRTSCSPSTRWT